MLRDAATVLLLRDSVDGLKVFMTVRNKKMTFASGALVFPGGSVDRADTSNALRPFLPLDSVKWSKREIGWRVAAVREVYEEAGVLLARTSGGVLLADRLREINERSIAQRLSGDFDIVKLVDREDLILSCDELYPFAHWITPENRLKRFDTRFYLTTVPMGQEPAHDGSEGVDSVWGTPREILDDANRGRWRLRFPTRITLEKLVLADSVQSAITLANTSNVIPVTSTFTTIGGRRVVEIPLAADFGFTNAVLDGDGNIIERW